MNLNQLSIAAGTDLKWLLNSSPLLGRPLHPSPAEARWWGLVHLLESTFGLTLGTAGDAATRALTSKNDAGEVVVAEDPSSATAMSVNLVRYESTALANLSRSLVRETPKQRGRRAQRSRDPIAAAAEYGLDVDLMRSSLARTPAERLAALDRNRAFVYEMRRSRRKR